MDEAPAQSDVEFLSASRLAASGKFDEAQVVLCPDGQLPTTSYALDLLARIAVQTGDFERARKLWQAALQKEPSYEPAKKALASLGSPWFAFAVVKRIAFLVTVTIIVSLAFVGFLALLNVAPTSTPQAHITVASRTPAQSERSASLAQAKPVVTLPPADDEASTRAIAGLKEFQEQQAHLLNNRIQELQNNQTNILASQNKTDDRVASLLALVEAQSTKQQSSQNLIEQTRTEISELANAYAKNRLQATNPAVMPQQLPPLDISIDGISGNTQQGIWTIRFDAGLFDRDDHFQIGSKSLLESVARALVQTQEKIKVEVVGFADNEPPTWPWSKPRSDAMLGQLRANRVKAFLERQAIFPVSVLSATNGAPTERPYSNQSRRNRPVILRISRH